MIKKRLNKLIEVLGLMWLTVRAADVVISKIFSFKDRILPPWMKRKVLVLCLILVLEEYRYYSYHTVIFLMKDIFCNIMSHVFLMEHIF